MVKLEGTVEQKTDQLKDTKSALKEAKQDALLAAAAVAPPLPAAPGRRAGGRGRGGPAAAVSDVQVNCNGCHVAPPLLNVIPPLIWSLLVFQFVTLYCF